MTTAPNPGSDPQRPQSPRGAKRAGALARLRAARKPKNPTGDMTLVEHLQELRRRLFFAVLFIGIGTIVGFYWYAQAPFSWPSLGDFLRGPYCDLPANLRASFTNDNECRLLATKPFEMFMLRLKVGALAGLVISSPFWLYQVWAFVVPGLHKNERRWTYIFVFFAVLLFLAGAFLSYFVMSQGLEFLLSVGDEFQTTALSGGDYYNYFLAMLVIFGISFEVPLVIVMLNILGILAYTAIQGKRRLIIVIVMIFAAVLTPGGEPIAMVTMGTAVCLLVEIAFQLCRINDKRRNRERPEWMDLDDEQASGPISASGPIGSAGLEAPQPVDAPAPVAPSSSGYSRAQVRREQGLPPQSPQQMQQPPVPARQASTQRRPQPGMMPPAPQQQAPNQQAPHQQTPQGRQTPDGGASAGPSIFDDVL